MIVRCENGLSILPERPRPRAWKRFITSPLPTCACDTTRSSMSSWWLFSALAIADCRHLRTSLAMRLRENSRSASAVATFLPRMSCASRLSFCGLTRSIFATAFASFSASARGWLGLLMSSPRSRRARRRRALDLAVGRVAMERAGRRELAELVPDHFLGHQHWNVLVAVVDPESEPDELRHDGRAPAPGLDHVVTAGRTRGFRFLEQIAVDERAFPVRTRHDGFLAYCVFFRAWRLEMMNLPVDLFLRVFLPLVGKPHGVTGWPPPLVRPPCGWATGFMVMPRLCGMRPFQRTRPALPIEMFM